jgi:hypothetical protein
MIIMWNYHHKLENKNTGLGWPLPKATASAMIMTVVDITYSRECNIGCKHFSLE